MVDLPHNSVTTLGALAVKYGARLDKPRFKPSSLLLLFPAAALLIGLFIYPVGYSVYLGFTNLQLIGPNSIHYRFTGLQMMALPRQTDRRRCTAVIGSLK